MWVLSVSSLCLTSGWIQAALHFYLVPGILDTPEPGDTLYLVPGVPYAFLLALQQWEKKRAYDTAYSQAVTHPSTNAAQSCLTSVIGRELVFSTWYGRRHEQWLNFPVHCGPVRKCLLCVCVWGGGGGGRQAYRLAELRTIVALV